MNDTSVGVRSDMGTSPGEVRFVDTTFRDGQMSLWATRMTTDEILPLARSLDEAGFAAAEVLGSAFVKKLVRELRDDPFERIRRLKELMPRTPLRLIHSRHTAAFQVTPHDVYRLWTERLRAHGIDEVRMSDPSNTVADWARNMDMARAAGLRVILNLVFTSSPKHDDEYFRLKARAAARLRPGVICIKDPGGLLTPDRIRTLVPVVQSEVGDIPLEFHGHCNNGFGLINAMDATRLGVHVIDTAIPPLANGGSLPSATRLAGNLRALGHDVAVDDDAVARVGRGIEDLRRLHGLPEGRTAEYDVTYYGHQVPGGMASNLRFQLGRLGIADRLGQVLEEVARVREDLGYPIMVTPYSQFVGTQATLNVVTGRRYGQVLDEIVEYAAGRWGKEEAEGVRPELRDRLLEDPRAAELARADEEEQLSVAELRRRMDATHLDDDDFLLTYFTSQSDVAALRARPRSLLSNVAAEQPWVALVERMASLTGIRRLEVSKAGTTLVMSR